MKKFALYSGVLLAVAWIAGFAVFNEKINSYPRDSQTRTDAIIALTGGKFRIGEAVRLLNRGMAPKLLISGVQENISPKDIERINAVKFSDNPQVEIENKSRNTIENAIEANEWLEKNHIQSIRLVTSNYHLPRSLEEFKARNPELKIVVHPVYSDNVSKKWWKNSGSFCLIASEYNKFMFVYVKNYFNRILGM